MLAGRLLTLLFLAAAVLAAYWTSPAAQADHVGYLTFEGPAGGGTMRVTLTSDLSAAVRAEVQGVQFQPNSGGRCGTTATGIDGFDPPGLVEDGQFSMRMFGPGASSFLNIVVIDGTIVSPSRIEGSATYSEDPLTMEICSSEPLPFVLEGPVETPPNPGDQIYVDPVAGGEITLALDAAGDTLTYLALAGVPLACRPDDALDLVEFYDPPLAQDATTGGWSITTGVLEWLGVTGSIAISADVTATAPSGGAIEGTILLTRIPSACDEEIAFSARFVRSVPTPTPGASPTSTTSTATPPPAPTATPPTATGAAPSALPAAGGGDDASGRAWPVAAALLLGMGLLLAMRLSLRK